MSNPRKPNHLKVIAGTTRKDRDTQEPLTLPKIAEIPSPPDWLPNAHALQEWNRLAPILIANRLLTEVGVTPLAHLCALHGKIVQLHIAGAVPNAAFVSQYRNLINDFGLTPVAQGKVKSVGEKPESNSFSRNGKRPR